ncbi:MAG: hypothetical protein IJ927_02575 [Eubacterium sp.]|nr:hypothetical protein [Eubacterium sp.]
MRISKKILACVLAALMAVAMMPFTVFANDLPTATVSVVTDDPINTENLDVAYKFSANNDGADYYGYNADFIVSVDKAGLSTDDFQLYGKYTGYDWICATGSDYVTYTENYDYYMLKAVLGADVTYEEICTIVKDFYCGVKVNNAENAKGATLTVKLVIYDGDSEPITIGDVMTYTIGEEKLPAATITPIEVEGLDAAYKFEADTTDTDSAYADYKADFTVSFDKAVAAGDVVLKGQYGNYAWTEVNLPATLAADVEYRLLANNGMGDVTYNDVVTLVKEFNCGVANINADGVTMTVKFNIYDANDNAFEIASKSYTFITDTMSITVADDINLNINVATEDDDAAYIVYSFTNPDTEDASKTNEVTVPATGDVTSFTVPLAPAQVRDEIVATVYDENGDYVRDVTTSIAEYCETILLMTDAQLGTKAEELKELAKATLDYGYAASDYFNYNEDAYSGYTAQLADPTAAINDATAAALTANGPNRINSDYGIAFSSVSYVANSKPELRFYINTSSVTDFDLFEAHLGEINNSITSNMGTSAQMANLEQDGRYLLQVKNIDIADFGKKIIVKSYYNDSFVEFTPLTWVKAAIVNPNLSDLGKAIGNYYLKAVGYFGDNA